MSHGIEARHLSIVWAGPGRAARVEVGALPLEIEEEAGGDLVLEARLFAGRLPWLGLRLTGWAAQAIPRLLLADGRELPMMRVDGSDAAWWVEDGPWDPARSAHLSEMQRSAGAWHVAVGSQRLRIDVVEDGLGPAELDALLDSFHGELLSLILGDGAATGKVRGAGGGAGLAEAAAAFAAAVRRVLRAPPVDLREALESCPRDRLRAGPATFRDHARHPSARRLAGRVAVATHDLPEARHLRHLAGVAARLARAAEAGAAARAGVLGRLGALHRNRAAELLAERERPVEPAIFERQLADDERRMSALAGYRSENEEGHVATRRLRIGKPYGRDGRTFFVDEDRDGGPYRVVQIPRDLVDLLRDALHLCRAYALQGRLVETEETNTKRGKYRLLRFETVTRVEPCRDVVAEKRARRDWLARRGWVAPLTTKERRENEREAAAAERRAEALGARTAATDRAAASLAAAREGLAAAERAFAALGVGLSPRRPAGMRFLRDPAFAAALAAWNALRAAADAAGIDEGLLDGLEHIALLPASDLYEKWCLLRVLGLLVNDYRFQAPPGWQARLVEAAVARRSDFSLLLTRPDVGLQARVTWQMVLPNGRRPDVVVEVRRVGVEGASTRGLVMDAKFRARWRPSELEGVLRDLRRVKGYDRDGAARVFVLHFAQGAHDPPTSPLAWGRHATYGQRRPGNHRGGAVWVAPAADESHLKRLLALELQHAFAPPTPLGHAGRDGEGYWWESDSFCVECGERHDPRGVTAKTTKGGYTSWTLDCLACGQATLRTHCYQCDDDGRRTLWKNGSRLTYHETVADDLSNVMCPRCGAYFDEGARGDGGEDRR